MPEDLSLPDRALPHPAACRDAAAPEGWRLERDSFVQDDERVLDLHLSQPGAPARAVALRLVGPEGAEGPVLAFWAFAAACFAAATRADLPEQDAGVDAMATLLGALFPADADPDAEGATAQHLRAAWAETRARLSAGLDAAEAAGFSGDALRALSDTRDPLVLGLPVSGLSQGADDAHIMVQIDRYGSRQVAPGLWKAMYTGLRARQRPRPWTEADVAALDFLSGHEKMEILAGVVPDDARLAFDDFRGAGPEPRRLHPPRRRGGIGLRKPNARFGDTVLARSPGGDHLSVRLGSPDHPHADTWEIWARFEALNTRMRLSDTECGILKRLVSGDGAFRTPALLEDAAARLVAMILELDHPVPAALLPEERDGFDPGSPVLAHPALEGRAIPPRHRPLVGLLLGAPYARAREEAEKAAAREAKKAAKKAAAQGLADQLPDGAIFGRVARSRAQDILQLQGTKLGLVRTVPGKGKRRKRELAALCGFETSRPLTATHLSRMKRIEKPAALTLVHDAQVHDAFGLKAKDNQRDGIEGAFRLSFLLAPGALNPIMEGGVEVEKRAGADGGPPVRVTVSAHEGTALLVLCALVDRDFGDDYRGTMSGATGAAVGAVVHESRAEAWVRPALRGMDVAMPGYDRASLRAALEGLAQKDGVDPRLIAALEAQLGAPWDKLAKKWGATWPAPQ